MNENLLRDGEILGDAQDEVSAVLAPPRWNPTDAELDDMERLYNAIEPTDDELDDIQREAA